MSLALVISANGESFGSLLSHIVSFEDLCSGNTRKEAERRRSAVASLQQEFDVVQSVIDNKYYRAEVAYVFADLSVLASEQFDELSAECDAIIVLDDAQTVALEHDIFKIARDKQVHASTKLFVTLTEDAQAVSDEHREKRIDWCIDNQFEFIHLDKSNPIEGWQEREKDGLPRLMEALSTTMWRAMEMKNEASRKAGVQESKRSEVPPSQRQEAVVAEVPESTQLDVLEQLARSEQGIALPSFAGLGGDHDDDDEDEDGMRGFNDILQSVARIREAAMNGNMSDEERRAKAAEMALRLAQTLGLDMEDSDNDEHEA